MKGAVLLGVASIAAVAASPPLAAHGAGVDEIAGYRLIAASEARRTGVPQQIVDAVMRVESGYDPMASGDAGEIGLMQILPGTAAMLGFRGTIAELREPHTNIRFGTAYLAQAWRLAGGDLCTTVMKYRAGHGETRFSSFRSNIAGGSGPISQPSASPPRGRCRPPPSACRCRS